MKNSSLWLWFCSSNLKLKLLSSIKLSPISSPAVEEGISQTSQLLQGWGPAAACCSQL